MATGATPAPSKPVGATALAVCSNCTLEVSSTLAVQTGATIGGLCSERWMVTLYGDEVELSRSALHCEERICMSAADELCKGAFYHPDIHS